MEGDGLDIHIDGHMSVKTHGGQTAYNVLDTPVESSNVEQSQSKDQHMQALFDRTVCEELFLPYEYQNVNVLIIRWADHLDRDLKCGGEVQELRQVFDTRFNFKTHILTLDDTRSPQLQLNNGITSFIMDHDGPFRSHLLMLYYTGHGVGKKDGLYITGVRDPSTSAINSKHPPCALWNKAEDSLLNHAEADVLMIMDTCCAGNVMKGTVEDLRSFEVVCAAPAQMPTAAPGPRSFTRAMIDALIQQLDSPKKLPFTAFDLNAKIIATRQVQHSQVFTKLNSHTHTHRHIKLAPLRHATTLKTPILPSPEASFLTVRFSFEKIKFLLKYETVAVARMLSQAASESGLGINRIEWVGASESKTGRSIWDAVLLLRAVKQVQRLWRQRQSRQRQSRKREREHDSSRATEDDPAAKRFAAGPMTPVSTATRSNHESPA